MSYPPPVQHVATPIGPIEMVQMIADLKQEHWTSDDWNLFWDQMELSEDVATRLTLAWNEGWESGNEDGQQTRQESDWDDGYADGHAEGIREAEKKRRAQSETTTLTNPSREHA